MGALLGPLLAHPFISGVRGFAATVTLTTTTEPTDIEATTADDFLSGSNTTAVSVKNYVFKVVYSESWDQSSIEYAYVVVFTLGLVVAAAFVFSFFASALTGTLSKIHGSYSTDERCAAILLPKNWALGSGLVGSLVPIMTFLAIILQSLLNFSTSKYAQEYALDSNIGFTADNIWIISTVSIGGGLLGRATGAICSRYVPIGYILLVAAAGQSLMSLLCLVIGSQLMDTLLILLGCFCFFRDAIIPIVYSWSSHYILLYGVVVGVAELCAQLAVVVFTPMMDQLYHDVAIRTVFTSAIVFAVVLFILTWFMIWFGKSNYSYNKNMKKIFASFRIESIDISQSYVKCQDVDVPHLDSSCSTF